MQTADYETQRGTINTLHRVILTRTPKSIQTGRKVVDVGVLTIEEVITAKGKRAYMFTARNQKRGYDETLKKIMRACEKELIRIGALHKDRSSWNSYRREHRKEVNAKQRNQYATNKDIINQKRRERYAEKMQLNQALKAQMAALPER